MTFEWFDAIVLMGCANACVFAAMILTSRSRSASSWWLAAVLVVMSLLCAKILLHTLGLWQTPRFRYFPLGIDLWLPPLLWLYVLALTEPAKLRWPLYRQHLLVPMLFLGYALVVYVCTVTTSRIEAKAAIVEQLGYASVKAFEDILSVVFGVYYGWLAFRQLQRYQWWVDTYLSNTAIPTYRWLRNLLVVTAIVLLLLGLMLASQQMSSASFVALQGFYGYLVFLIYVFGFFGFRHQDFRVSLDLIARKSEALSDTQQASLLEKLHAWMQADKPYLNPDLNLAQCADKLRCSPQTLSEAINLGQNKNFREYVNGHRIDEFKRQITAANLQKETIMGVAYACGFNSEASFYRIFKEKTGMTPREFLSK